MAETRPSHRLSRALVAACAAGVCGLAAGGFTLSFAALRDLAVASGIDPGLAFLWPLIVDGFIVVATACAFALRHKGRAVTWYPWAALVLFSAVSVVGNAMHANDARIIVPRVAATAVSAVPAVALLIATHLLVVIAEHRPPAGSLASPQSPSPSRARVRRPAASPFPPNPAGVGPSESLPTSREIALAAGVSERTGRRRLAALRAAAPDLPDPAAR